MKSYELKMNALVHKFEARKASNSPGYEFT